MPVVKEYMVDALATLQILIVLLRMHVRKSIIYITIVSTNTMQKAVSITVS